MSNPIKRDFDLEAEAEGNARSRAFHNGCGKANGKKLIKMGALHRGAKTVTSRFLVLESEKMR